MRNSIFFILLCSVFTTTQADIITDGSLGQQLTLPGSDYQITQDLGKTIGNNLFHSFAQFNLASGESATFSGADSLQNVISRVTGGEPSQLNGLLRSTLSNADVYLINPYGIVLGESARLDVQGGFHASTADYLTLADGAKFHARLLEQTVLSVAPVASFGFLTDAPAPIAVHDSDLRVPTGATLSLVGGQLTLENSLLPTYDSSSTPTFATQLSASAGRVNLASLAAAGTVTPTLTGLEISDAAKLGNLALKNFSVNTSGVRGGDIFIRAGALVLENSQINSHTLGPIDGGVIDVQVGDLILRDSDILAYTFAPGEGADINIAVANTLRGSRINRETGIITVPGASFGLNHGSSQIGTLTADLNPAVPSGAGGDVHVTAQRIEFSDGASLSSISFSESDAGNIAVAVQESLIADGAVSLGQEAIPLIGGMNSFSASAGNSGNIQVTAQQAQFTRGAGINASTAGSGRGGDIAIEVERLEVSDIHASENGTLVFNSAITSIAFGEGSKAGQIAIYADDMWLREGGGINTGAAFGESSELSVYVTNELVISGVTALPLRSLNYVFIDPNALLGSSIGANAFHAGPNGSDGSDISVRAKHILIENGGLIGNHSYGGGNVGNLEVLAETIAVRGAFIRQDGKIQKSGISNRSFNSESYAGNAGDMTIHAKQIILEAGGEINAQAANAGGGNIEVIAEELLYLDSGLINTSVQNGGLDGGNIDIKMPRLSILNKGQIIAQADVGHGGNIELHSDYLLQTPGSLIDASSRLGIDGDVMISSPSIDLFSHLVDLSATFLEADKLLPKPCSGGTKSSFVAKGQDGIGGYPSDLWGSSLDFAGLSPSNPNLQYASAMPVAYTEMAGVASNSLVTECARSQ